MIKKLALSNFRNFTKREFNFSPNITAIVAPNACGKTNILEALYLLATGRSFKAHLEEEMISYDCDLARVSGVFLAGASGDEYNLEVVLTRGQINIGEDKFERTSRKKLYVNGVSRRLIDFTSNFKVTLFGPWDMDLVTGSPSLRRHFLDMVLSQTDLEYRRSILSYEKGLRQRNRLLFKVREEGISRSQLLFWDKLLIKNGNYITEAREEMVSFINQREGLGSQSFNLEYDKSPISEGRIDQYREEEVAAATTLVGPHRDDIKFEIINSKPEACARDLGRYGSRGEQRMAILWLKLAELAYIEKKTFEKPTLLLDDIFSELDHEHRAIVMGACLDRQSIITTADPHYIVGLNELEKIEI
jgi:DNA replication and repair protein RecF